MTGNRNESSMEEILSSIKRIIAEDKQMPLKRAAKAPEPAPEPILEEEDEDEDAAVLELTDAMPDDDATDEEILDDRLIDDGKLAAMRDSLHALATMGKVDARKPSTEPSRGGKTVEELVAETLRPMLKDWLDENLPDLVESMVAREIQRISRD